MANYLETAVFSLNDIGVLDIALPFILIFSVVWAILEKIKIFTPEGKSDEYNAQNKKVHIAIAFVVALVPVFVHIMTPNAVYNVIPLINSSLADVSLIVIAVLAVLILLGMGGFQLNHPIKDLPKALIFIAAIGFVLYVFGSNFGIGWWDLAPYLSAEVITIIISLLIFVAVIFFVTGKPQTDEDNKISKKLSKTIKHSGDSK